MAHADARYSARAAGTTLLVLDIEGRPCVVPATHARRLAAARSAGGSITAGHAIGVS